MSHGQPSDERAPARAAVATATAIALLMVLWVFRLGGWSLLLVPLLGVWVVTVYLGAPLNAPIQFARLRRLRP